MLLEKRERAGSVVRRPIFTLVLNLPQWKQTRWEDSIIANKIRLFRFNYWTIGQDWSSVSEISICRKRGQLPEIEQGQGERKSTTFLQNKVKSYLGNGRNLRKWQMVFRYSLSSELAAALFTKHVKLWLMLTAVLYSIIHGAPSGSTVPFFYRVGGFCLQIIPRRTMPDIKHP